MWSRGKDVGRCCFAVSQDETDADEGRVTDPPGVCGIAQLMTGDGGSAEVNPHSELESPVPGSRSRHCDAMATVARPGDVLTDVVLRLTFDNTAYVEEACDGAEASGLLPDNPPGNSPSVFIRLSTSRNPTNSLQQSSFPPSPVKNTHMRC